MFELVMITLCIVLNALLAGFETAFVATSRPLVRRLAQDKSQINYKRLLSLKENPERTLSVIQVGITFVGMFAAAVGGVGAEKALSPYLREMLSVHTEFAELLALLAVTIPLTYFTVVFGELIPKAIALRNPLKISSKFSHVIAKLTVVFWPVVLVLEKSTKILLKRLPMMQGSEPSHSDYVSEEFAMMSAHSKVYVLNLLKLEKTVVSSVTIPWSEVDILESGLSMEAVESKIIQSGHTRLPVFEAGRCTGILNAKEFLALLKTGEANWGRIVRPAVLLHEQSPLLAAFRMLQKEKVHMGVVQGVRGGHLGIVTMEDIFEEIVGDIEDEDDEGSILRILAR